MKKICVFTVVLVIALSVTNPVFAQADNPPSGVGWECFDFDPVPVGTVVILREEFIIDQLWIDGEFFYESIAEEDSNLYMILDLGTTEVRAKKEQSPQITVMCYHMDSPATATSLPTYTPSATSTPSATATPSPTSAPSATITPFSTSTDVTAEITVPTVKTKFIEEKAWLITILIVVVVLGLYLLISRCIKNRRHH